MSKKENIARLKKALQERELSINDILQIIKAKEKRKAAYNYIRYLKEEGLNLIKTKKARIHTIK